MSCARRLGKYGEPRGRGPLDRLQHEEFQEFIDYWQNVARYNLQKATRRRQNSLRKERQLMHHVIEKPLGPDWFQELSAQQKCAVEDLAQAIGNDIKQESTENTQTLIGKLGIVTKRCQRHVRRALDLCAKCPIEFLLILYQLMKSNRQQYNINDRLLLSAVAHLTLRDTLRELHVRIPSPPRKLIQKEKPKTIVKKASPSPHAKSPYLQKLHRPKPSHERQLIQAPQIIRTRNPYFDYVETFKDAPEGTTDIAICTSTECQNPNCRLQHVTPIEMELLTEWSVAQRYYNSLNRTEYFLPALFKPSVYVRSMNQFCANKKKVEILKEPTTMTESCSSDYDHNDILEQSPVSPTTSQTDISKDEEIVEEVEEGEAEEEKETQPCTIRDYYVGPVLYTNTPNTPKTCACKEAALNRIEQSLCHCEKCEEDRRKQNTIVTKVIDGIRQLEEDEMTKTPVIKDIKAKSICTCMEKYKKQWLAFEKQYGVRRVQETLKSLEERFVISGTTVGPDGKIVYIISSVMPKWNCTCARIQEMDEAQKAILEQMPKFPEGCIKYHISGVQARPEGNVYVLSGVTNNYECECMALFNRYTREHSLCLMLYEAYLKKIAFDKEEYMKELNPEYLAFEEPSTDRSEPSGSTLDCVCSSTTNSIESYIGHVNEEEDEEEEEADSDYFNDCECLSVSNSSTMCICPSSGKIDNDKIEQLLNRYVILEKLPTSCKDQTSLLKKVLARMAEDGFPLARLPNVHTLPIFQAWWRFRLKQFYTRAENVKMLKLVDQPCLDRIGVLRTRIRVVKSKFLAKQKRMWSWEHHHLIKTHNLKEKGDVYRKMKHASIDYARILFAGLRQYHFPHPSFRETFFTYMPSKEEFICPVRLWQKFEQKVFIRLNSCF